MATQSKRSRWPNFAWLSVLLALHCGRSAKFSSDPTFNGENLQHLVVLVLPIAVTDDLGDERTGIVLDRESREQATKLACRSAVAMREDVNILCFDGSELASSAALTQGILLDHARDNAIPAERWQELGVQTGASFVVLFRPEAVSANQVVSKHYGTAMGGAFFTPLPTSMAPSFDVKTSRTYTLSSSLVDLREGKTVRVGVQSAKASTSTTESPDAARHLHGIMRDLMKGQLSR